MSKRLLNEVEVRKFMKYADIGAMSDGFVSKINEDYYGRDDDPTMEQVEEEAPLEDEPLGEPEGVDLGAEEPMEEPVDDEFGAEEEAPADPEAEFGDLIQGIVSQITSWAEAAGVEVPEASVEGAGEEPMEEPMGEPMEEPMGEPAEEPMGAPEEAPEEELAEADIELEEDAIDEDEMINEVTRRVARRLLAVSKKSA